jgi:peptidoglycan/xylan/chitin deacetylase (PgdA/CDA1 family)
MAGRDRDLVGYGRHTPAFTWPEAALVAVNLVVNYEEGSEAEWEIDRRSEDRGEIAYPFPADQRNLAMESMFEYGSRAGIWRLLRIFDEYRVPATFFASSMALERNPEVAQFVRDSPHDICGHGRRWSEPWTMSREEERAEILGAVASLTASCGKRPLGWYWRFSPTVHTRDLLVEEGGFLYDSDAYNDDLPYFVEVQGQRHLVIPYSTTYNDGQGDRSPRSFVDYCIRGFDELAREGAAGAPKMMSIGMHPRRMGQAGRASALREFLEHAQRSGQAWFATRSQIAAWWSDTFR